MNASPEDLAERIDASFGSGPDLPPSVDLLLARGRRARRGRRLALTAVAASAIAVVTTGAVLLSGQPAEHARDEFVSSPTPSATTSPTTSPTTEPTTDPTSSPTLTAADRERLKRLAQRAVSFGDGGDVSLPSGSTVVRFLDNPYGAVAPAWSEGLAVEFRGHEFWYAMTGPGDGSSGGQTQYLVTDDSRDAFEQWVAEQNPGGATTSFVGPDVWPDVVQLDPVRMLADSDRLTARPGFTVVDQRPGARAGAGWADPTSAGEESAAALVRADDGASYFVLARRFDGKAAQYVVVPQTGNGADLAAFLDLARQRYADAR